MGGGSGKRGGVETKEGRVIGNTKERGDREHKHRGQCAMIARALHPIPRHPHNATTKGHQAKHVDDSPPHNATTKGHQAKRVDDSPPDNATRKGHRSKRVDTSATFWRPEMFVSSIVRARIFVKLTMEK